MECVTRTGDAYEGDFERSCLTRAQRKLHRHALEVGWPDETPTPTPDAFDGFNDTFDHEQLELQDYIWPDIQPQPTGTPASSLRG